MKNFSFILKFGYICIPLTAPQTSINAINLFMIEQLQVLPPYQSSSKVCLTNFLNLYLGAQISYSGFMKDTF